MRTKESEKDVGSFLDLASYMATVIEQLRRDGKFPAAHGYLCALHSFQTFAGGADVPLPLHEVFTRSRLKAYEEWLLTHQNRKLNTVSSYMRTLQAVYNRWMLPGTPGHDAQLFSNVYTRVVSPTKRALTEGQMEQLLSVDVCECRVEVYGRKVEVCKSKADVYGRTADTCAQNKGDALTEAEQAALAYFLLMFVLRGMPFIDLAYLRKCDMQGGYITYRRHKTGKQLTVKIDPSALRLIQKYRDRDSDNPYLFPILKADAESGWQQYHYYQDALRRFNRMLKRTMRHVLPGVAVSSYTARHTWATIAYHMGQPIGIISQSLGHSSIRVTETYLKPFEDACIDELNRQLIVAVKKGKWKRRMAYNTL